MNIKQRDQIIQLVGSDYGFIVTFKGEQITLSRDNILPSEDGTLGPMVETYVFNGGSLAAFEVWWYGIKAQILEYSIKHNREYLNSFLLTQNPKSLN